LDFSFTFSRSRHDQLDATRWLDELAKEEIPEPAM
jgi:hypothetical protein